jgi:alkanesulfonate monooxygenase SsuD/methylene tetrahydromethanopterin reductase-like flavin-dependent oxidoreductase (luciferase family)
VRVTELRLGVALWSQATDWLAFLEAGRRVDRLGFDHLWTWDHLYAIFGDPHQPILEGYTALAALAQATQRTRLGLFVGANTFRNPGLVAKATTTIDHISGGRAILGIGGAWFELEHRAYGLDFGRGFGERLDWLAEAVPAIRTLLDGGEVTSAGGRYGFDRLRLEPRPLQERLPIMVGGSGERKTLPIVARWADIWNAFGSPAELAHKDEVLRRHCRDAGRDEGLIERTVGCKVTIRKTEAEARRALAAILAHNGMSPADVADDATFWTGTPEQIAETMVAYRRVGFHTFLVESPAPYDEETMVRLMADVRPLVEAQGPPSAMPPARDRLRGG